MNWRSILPAALLVLPLGAVELHVGPEQAFAHLEDAVLRAAAGDVILVHPLPNQEPYAQVGLNITTPRLTLKATGGRVVLSGKGGDQSGRGARPRAIVQFSRGADGGVLEGFELTGAHNHSHNGAGVRINQANDVTIRDCVIHHNDMGLMSNGDGTSRAGVNQMIEHCLIHANGDASDPGFNHNLYLGGYSVTLLGCEVHSSLTGHNIKSRAHKTIVHACYVHDSANREFDLVDAQGDTTTPGSDAVLAGNVIVKARHCSGNRGVIHFGQDGGKDHDGTLYLLHNTMVTPYVSPVVLLSSGKAHVQFFNNLIWDGGGQQSRQQLLALLKTSSQVQGAGNWRSEGFSDGNGYGRIFAPASLTQPPFRNASAGDYRLRERQPEFADAGRRLPQELLRPLRDKLRQFQISLGSAPRSDEGRPALGAFALDAP